MGFWVEWSKVGCRIASSRGNSDNLMLRGSWSFSGEFASVR